MQDVKPLGEDGRSVAEKVAWRLIGPPLYYCEQCLVGVTVAGEPPVVTRHCEHHDARIIAPRRAIVSGDGTLSPANRVRMALASAKSALTGRT